MTRKNIRVAGSKVLVMGLTFKENCPDLRNTRVVDIIAELQDYSCQVDVYDPWVSPQGAKEEYGLELSQELKEDEYDAIILAVAHDQFKELDVSCIKKLGKAQHVLYDLKNLFAAHETDQRL